TANLAALIDAGYAPSKLKAVTKHMSYCEKHHCARTVKCWMPLDRQPGGADRRWLRSFKIEGRYKAHELL
ncbi:hypothetical protein CX680_31285, partial [Klebsiella pneumoniae]